MLAISYVSWTLKGLVFWLKIVWNQPAQGFSVRVSVWIIPEYAIKTIWGWMFEIIS